MTGSRFDGKRYRNPGPSASRSLAEVLRWQATARSEAVALPRGARRARRSALGRRTRHGRGHVREPRHVPAAGAGPRNPDQSDLVGAGEPGPVRRAAPRARAGLPFDALPRVGLVLLSHNHYDHLDRPTLARLEAVHRPPIVTLAGNDRYLAAQGLTRVHALDWWQSIEVHGARITATPAQHFSGRGLLDRNRALWGGFVVEWEGPTVYVAADTGYWSHFHEVREQFGRVGLALLPIGAYEPRWFMGPAHMNPADAVRAHLDLGGPPSIGMHFGTFRLTDEAWDDPPRALAAALAAHGIERARFRVPRPGQTFVVGGGRPAIDFGMPPSPRFETLAVHAGAAVDPATGAVTAPIHLSTTFERAPDASFPSGFGTRAPATRRASRSNRASPRSREAPMPRPSPPGRRRPSRCSRRSAPATT